MYRVTPLFAGGHSWGVRLTRLMAPSISLYSLASSEDWLIEGKSDSNRLMVARSLATRFVTRGFSLESPSSIFRTSSIKPPSIGLFSISWLVPAELMHILRMDGGVDELEDCLEYLNFI